MLNKNIVKTPHQWAHRNNTHKLKGCHKMHNRKTVFTAHLCQLGPLIYTFSMWVDKQNNQQAKHP